MSDKLNTSADYIGTVESFDTENNHYKVHYEDHNDEYLTKTRVSKIIERYNYWNMGKDKTIRKRARERSSNLQCACGCNTMDDSREFVSCERKRNCLTMIHTNC